MKQKFNPTKQLVACCAVAVLLVLLKFERTEMLGWFPAIAAKATAVALILRAAWLSNRYKIE